MNSKSTNKSAGRATGKPEARRGAQATTQGKALRSGDKPSKPPMYGIYREDAPAAKAAPPVGRAPAAPALAEALRAVTAEVKALKNDLAQKDAEIKAIQKRLTHMEARQKSQEKAFRAQHPPAGTIATQAISGRPDAEETPQDLPAPLKDLD